MSDPQDPVVQESADLTIASVHTPQILDADPMNRIGDQRDYKAIARSQMGSCHR